MPQLAYPLNLSLLEYVFVTVDLKPHIDIVRAPLVALHVVCTPPEYLLYMKNNTMHILIPTCIHLVKLHMRIIPIDKNIK